MSQDADCEHDLVLDEIHADGIRLRMVATCRHCGATAYEPSTADRREAQAAIRDTEYDGRQPGFSRRTAHPDIG